MSTVELRQLFATSRASTSLFSAALCWLGFRYYPPVPLTVAIASALAFLCVPASIMSLNDYVDREHDTKKGKRFASEHAGALLRYWSALSGLTAALVIALIALAPTAGLFCLGAWALGLVYSFLSRWLVANNLVVGVCTGSPVLVGMVHAHRVDLEPLLVFATFVFIMLQWEIYKDIHDRAIDLPYKRTLAAVFGSKPAAAVALFAMLAWGTCLLLYPHWLLKALALSVAVAGYYALRVLGEPSRALVATASLEWVVRVFLVALFVSQ